MSKPKTLLHSSKGKKQRRKDPDPETADEFLAAGVELEERGEKWRASGDIKSMRAFMQAIEVYDRGLERWPESFDLAYNKARIQFEIATHPSLAAHIQAPLRLVLQTALDSHRYALTLDQDNTDVLFNTAQVLTSLAETVVQDRSGSGGSQFGGSGNRHEGDGDGQEELDALALLHEALELFQRCLTLQELKFTEGQEDEERLQQEVAAAQQQQQQQQREDDGNEMRVDEGGGEEGAEGAAPSSEEPEERWAAIVEPVTKDTLIDTAVAQLAALTTLCGLLSTYPGHPGTGLPWVEEYSGKLLNVKIPAYLDGANPSRITEVTIAKATFLAAMLDALFRAGRIDLPTYTAELEAAFATGSTPLPSSSPEYLSTQADALIAFNAAVSERIHARDAAAQQQALHARWQALSTALTSLTTASKLSDVAIPAKIHLARGDTEMHRAAMASRPWEYEAAKKNLPTLLRNAATYYRGAAALARKEGFTEQEMEAGVKEAVATSLASGDSQGLAQVAKGRKLNQVQDVLQDMLDDQMLGEAQVEALGIRS